MILEIKSDKASAKIDSLGAQLISFQDSQDTEYIWQRNPQVWKNCSPILFPIVGNCRNTGTCIDGTFYQIPKHGPCKSTEFQLIEQADDSVAFSLTHEDFPEQCYPYKFQLQVRYSITETILNLTLTVKNLDTDSIFYCIGLHPGIRCPLSSEETFEDYRLSFSQPQTYGYRRYDLENLQFDMEREIPFPGDATSIPLNRELFSSDAIWFDRPCGHEVSLLNPAGKGLKASYPDFDTVAFWTQVSKDAAFLCIEPWNGSAVCSDEDDLFEHKNHLQRLVTSASKCYTMTLEILN